MRGASTLNNVSRSRSLDGRVADPGGACNVRERYTPPITRISKAAPAASPRIVEGIHLVSLYNYLYARLVDPTGAMDGRGDACPHFLSAARGGVPGSRRGRWHRTWDGPFPGAVGSRGRPRDRPFAGGGMARPAAAGHFAATHRGPVRLLQ